ncbi:unnamed protein product, partial [Choristocarpus tenellus]
VPQAARSVEGLASSTTGVPLTPTVENIRAEEGMKAIQQDSLVPSSILFSRLFDHEAAATPISDNDINTDIEGQGKNSYKLQKIGSFETRWETKNSNTTHNNVWP